jgi:hypothetical protein
MTRWSRHRVVDPEVWAQLPTEPGERPLAATHDADGGRLVGTDRALYIAAADGWSRFPWHRIDQARWDRDTERLVVLELADFGEPQPRHEVAMTEPGQLLELVRERVTASILLTRYVPVSGSRGLQVVARRSPIADGEVDWSVRLADSLDPSDAEVARAVEHALIEARDELGV